jgi:hypothetical protein
MKVFSGEIILLPHEDISIREAASPIFKRAATEK